MYATDRQDATETIPYGSPRLSNFGLKDETPAQAQPVDEDERRQQDWIESGSEVKALHDQISAFRTGKLSHIPEGWDVQIGRHQSWDSSHSDRWSVFVFVPCLECGMGSAYTSEHNGDIGAALARAYTLAVADLPDAARAELAAFQAKQDAAAAELEMMCETDR
jgi:hypothetical protein